MAGVGTRKESGLAGLFTTLIIEQVASGEVEKVSETGRLPVLYQLGTS